MENRRYLSLEEIADSLPNSFVDGPFGSNLKSDEYSATGVRLIQLQNIGQGNWIDTNQKFIPWRKFKQLERHAAYPGDIAIAKMADPVARACVLPPVAEVFVVVADCIRLKPNPSLYDAKYVAYAINHHDTRLQAEQKSTGTTRQRINLAELKTVLIWAPLLHEQRAIADILDTIDDAIRHTEAVIAKLKDIRKGLLHDLLTRGIDKNGELRDPERNPEQFEMTDLGLLPKDWKVKELGNACTLIKDGTHLPPKRVPTGALLLSVQNMIDGTLKQTNADTCVSWEFYKQMHQNWQIYPGDVLLAIVGATIGKTAIVPNTLPPFTLQRSVAVIRGKEHILENQYLYHYSLSEIFSLLLWQRVNQTAQPGIYLDEISKIQIPLPEPDEQATIAGILDVFDKQIEQEKESVRKLSVLKQGLMDDLLTGRVRVTEMEGYAE